MTYNTFDVVVVPFPFTDRATSKRRPALVLSDKTFNVATGQAVLAMITSAAHSDWPLDVPIVDLKKAGLPSASVVRMKLFTLDEQLIQRKAGVLVTSDRKAVSLAIRELVNAAL